MNTLTRLRGALAAGLAATLLGGLAAAPLAARADDPPAKDKPAGKGKEKKPDSIPIKIVDPIIVPDKDKHKQGKDDGKK